MPNYHSESNVRPKDRTWLWIVGGVVALVVISVGGWLLSVGLAGTKGTGDLIRQRGSAENRKHWSAVFNGEYNTIQADQRNIATAKAAANAPGATKFDQTNLTGLIMNCTNDVAAYNGDTQNALAVVPDGLPSDIDANTTCGG